MNIITRIVHQTTNSLVSRIVSVKGAQTHNIHSLCSKVTSRIGENVQDSVLPASLLQPRLPILHQFHGMKYKVALRLRCKGCYFVTRKEIMYVMCKLKPRHKQSQIVAKPRSKWIWTFAAQSKKREW